jgi:hypothetical protein
VLLVPKSRPIETAGEALDMGGSAATGEGRLPSGRRAVRQGASPSPLLTIDVSKARDAISPGSARNLSRI